MISFLRIKWSLFIKRESLLPKYALCQVWLKLAHQFYKMRFLNFVKVHLLSDYCLPLGKGRVLQLNKLVSQSKGCFMPSLVVIGPLVLEKKKFKIFSILFLDNKFFNSCQFILTFFPIIFSWDVGEE